MKLVYKDSKEEVKIGDKVLTETLNKYATVTYFTKPHKAASAGFVTYIPESIVPGICMNFSCSNVYEYEPDQDKGWCDCCASNTVKSGLILAGLI